MEEVSESAEGGEAEEFLEDAYDEGEGVLRHRNKGLSSRARITISAASKLLRKKIPQSGLLMLPRRLWMQTVPAQDCDIVILFSGKCGEASVTWLVSCLRSRVPELIINVKSHLAVGCFALYVTATMNGLVKGGEDMKVCKTTKAEYGSGLRQFNQVELGLFQGVEEPSTFFTSQERQSIVLHLLNSLRAAEGDTVADFAFRPGQAILSKCQTEGIVTQILPLHDHTKLAHLRVTWVQSFFKYQPLEEIQEYFGTKIGIYFSWLGFYTASLTVPAVIGLVFWINFWGEDQAKEDKAFLVLAFLNVIWGSMWLEAWKRRSAELTHKWGTQEYHHELLEDPRPLFRGDLEISPVTGRLEPVYPTWKRNLFRYFVTLPVIFVCLALVFLVMFVILQIQAWWDSLIEYRGLPAFFSYGPKFIMAGTISVFDEGYTKIATWLNDMENYRSEESYQNHLIIKLAMFRLVNSFLVLFYIAFYLQDMDILKAQLAALFLTRQIVGNIKESCIPYFIEQLKLAKLSFELFGAISPSEASTGRATEDPNTPQGTQGIQRTTKSTESTESGRVAAENSDGSSLNKGRLQSSEEKKTQEVPGFPRQMSKSRIVSNAEVESNMSKYNDTFEDYLEMFIQFGYVMLFSSAFPLAAACAFLNNLIEIRSDAFKLCCVFQRPFGMKARSIGVWQDAMEFMSLLGIMVNCMLIGLSGQVHRMFPEMSTTQNILLIIVLEHAMIALKYGISYAIPDVPKKIAQEMAKAEFRRREAFSKWSISNSPPTREESEQSSPRSCLLSGVSSMEYIEKSVQTDSPTTTTSRKSSSESAKMMKDLIIPKRKGSADSRLESEAKHIPPIPPIPPFSPPTAVNLGRSVSAGDKVKHCIPKVSKRWNQSCIDNSRSPLQEGPGPSPAESLPVLSAPANINNKQHLFNFPTDIDKHPRVLDHKFSPEKESDSPESKSSESIAASTIREESIASDNNTEAETEMETETEAKAEAETDINILEELENSFEERRLSGTMRVQEGRKFIPSAESQPVSTPRNSSTEAIGEKVEPAKIGRRHPVKFLKRAQSFSQVFKKMADKRKKCGEALRDDFRDAVREPMGELSLIPLEKLVSIEDLQNQMITEEP